MTNGDLWDHRIFSFAYGTAAGIGIAFGVRDPWWLILAAVAIAVCVGVGYIKIDSSALSGGL